MRRTGFHRVVYIGLLACAILTGCQEEEPIVSYTVKKHELIQIPVETPGDLSPVSPVNAPFMSPPKTDGPLTIDDPTDRMLAAIVLDGGQAWFFKGKQSIDTFPEGAAEKFDTLLTTLKFEDAKKPTWELGEEWTEKPGSGMRVANLMLGDVEFSVIRLDVREGNERKYIVDNVNRWRGQVGLGGIDSPQLANMSHKIKTADGHDATVVDLLGKENAAATAPMAGEPRPRPKQTAPTAPPPESSGPPFESKVPESWTQQKAGMMQVAKYSVDHGEETATVSVVPLAGGGGGVKANIDRWRGQVGLEALASEDDIQADAIKVSDIDSMFIPIEGETKSIVVAMVRYNKAVWFFKLDGPKAAVAKETDSFREFLSTVRLK